MTTQSKVDADTDDINNEEEEEGNDDHTRDRPLVVTNVQHDVEQRSNMTIADDHLLPTSTFLVELEFEILLFCTFYGEGNLTPDKDVANQVLFFSFHPFVPTSIDFLCCRILLHLSLKSYVLSIGVWFAMIPMVPLLLVRHRRRFFCRRKH
jgi:hypothetical protein